VPRVPARARPRSSNRSRRPRPRPPARPRPWCRRARRLPSPQARVPRVRATTRSAWVAATLPRRVLDLVPARVRSPAATVRPARSPATRVRPARVPVAHPVRAVRARLPRRVARVRPRPVRAVLARTRATCPRGRTPA
jgi:hypothetical protein